jgi:hypothetical protein
VVDVFFHRFVGNTQAVGDLFMAQLLFAAQFKHFEHPVWQPGNFPLNQHQQLLILYPGTIAFYYSHQILNNSVSP